MNIGIIGSGNIGSALAKHLKAHGHDVVIANSRGPSSLDKIARETGAKAVAVEEAARAKDLIIITIPEAAVPNLPLKILAATKAVIVDTGNYYPTRDGQISEIESGLTESEWVSKVIGRDVVKAFNNIGAQSLVSKGTPTGTEDRVALSAAGNDPHQRKVVLQMIDEIGFDAVDAGGLSESWRQQPGTPAYCQDLSVDALKSALLQAEHSEVSSYRAVADEAARSYFLK